jgi:hypothetical protein
VHRNIRGYRTFSCKGLLACLPKTAAEAARPGRRAGERAGGQTTERHPGRRQRSAGTKMALIVRNEDSNRQIGTPDAQRPTSEAQGPRGPEAIMT